MHSTQVPGGAPPWHSGEDHGPEELGRASGANSPDNGPGGDGRDGKAGGEVYSGAASDEGDEGESGGCEWIGEGSGREGENCQAPECQARNSGWGMVYIIRSIFFNKKGLFVL